MDDQDIIRLYISGNDEAVDMLIDRYKNPLYKLCYHLSEERSEADDLFQETWVRVIKNIKNYDSDKSFQTWLYAICTNLYRDKYRKKKRWLSKIKEYFSGEDKDIEMENATDDSLLPEDKLINKQDRENLKKCIAMLDDIYRIPLILYYFKEISLNDIGKILDIPVGTVKSRLNYARTKLRRMMEVDEYE